MNVVAQQHPTFWTSQSSDHHLEWKEYDAKCKPIKMCPFTDSDKGSITQEAGSYSEYIIAIVQNGGSSIILWVSFAQAATGSCYSFTKNE